MSRLIVKNLPKNVSEQTIQQIFSQKGTVTDIQLKYTPEGKFRKFCFVGYQNELEAEEAIKSLNNTFIKTSKITVENCVALGDKSKPKAWSKYAADSEQFKKNNKKETESEDKEVTEQKKIKKKKKSDEAEQLLEKYKNDPLFEEYLQVHAPNESEKLQKLKNMQANEEQEENEEKNKHIINLPNEEKEESDSKSESEDGNKKLANEQISDLEYMKQLIKGETERKPREKMKKKVKEQIKLFTIKLRDLPYNIKKKDIKQFFKPISCYSVRIPRNIHGIAFVGFKTEKLLNKALIKNRSFINGKRILVTKYTTSEEKAEESGTANNNTSKNKWQSQEESLKNEESIGESGRLFIRNLAYTTTEEDIEKMFSKYGPLTEVNLPIDVSTKKMKGFGLITFLMPEHAVKAYSELDGSILHGRMVHLLPGKSKDTNEEDLDESSNFKKKKAAKQKAQAGSSHNWNALFLGHDAVAEVIADSFGTTKEAVIGPDGKGSAAVRLALGETQIVAQTRKYLEQEGVVLDAFANSSGKRSKTLILVKNLPSKTEAKEIREIFEKNGEVGRVILPPSGITAIIEFLEPSEARKAFTRLAYTKFKNMPLYLEWAPENSLKESSKDNTGKIVNTDDKKIQPEEETNTEQNNEENSNENNVEEAEEEEPEPDTTLFVKNLNFKTTDEGLKKVNESTGRSCVFVITFFLSLVVSIHILTFGEIRALRLPKKMGAGTDSHRGFAFIDYTTASDAKAAFEALSQSTHLYGRRLVLEWAAQEEGVDDIRKRTASHFRPEEEGKKKSKKSVFTM
uniref:Probable RNA-binding protein 19 n=1 Tax=Diabrotica virgifera virgifera TaxID=50390 RepID=A0A6P7FLT5_DIAVI